MALGSLSFFERLLQYSYFPTEINSEISIAKFCSPMKFFDLDKDFSK